MIKANWQFQKGAILVMALILLVILMFIAIAFTRITSLDIRSAKNYSDNVLMLSIAEDTLLDAEESIKNLTDPNTLPAIGFYQLDDPNLPNPFNQTTWDISSSTQKVIASSSNPTLGAYYVEKIMVISNTVPSESMSVNLGGYGEDATPSGGDITVFRSVVHAKNPVGSGLFMLESFYGKMF